LSDEKLQKQDSYSVEHAWTENLSTKKLIQIDCGLPERQQLILSKNQTALFSRGKGEGLGGRESHGA
jgi:hypothetical protein